MTVISKQSLDRLSRLITPGDPSQERYIDPADISFHPFLQARWQLIRRDVEHYLNTKALHLLVDSVTIEDYEWSDLTAWRSDAVYIMGEYNQLFAQLCPASSQIIETLCREHPQILSLGISVLGPGGHIAPHRDYNQLVHRYHLPLICEHGKSSLRVGGEQRFFEEGEGIALNFYCTHEAINLSLQARVTLMVDFLKPQFLEQPWVPDRFVCSASKWALPKVVPALKHLLRNLPQYSQVRIEEMVDRLDTARWSNQPARALFKLGAQRTTRLKRDKKKLLARCASRIRALGLSAEAADQYAELLAMAVYIDRAGAEVYTMLPRARLENLVECCSYLLTHKVEGAFLEAGVWRGGAGVLMRHVSQVLCDKREVVLLDSFEGMEDIAAASLDEVGDERDKLCAEILNEAERYFGQPVIHASVDEVRGNVRKLLGTDEGFTFLKGWFSPRFPWDEVPKLALIRLDCDYYQPTLCCLEHLYDKLSGGGVVILDEYYLEHMGEGRAVDEFRESRKIEAPLIRIDDNSCYWIKGRE